MIALLSLIGFFLCVVSAFVGVWYASTDRVPPFNFIGYSLLGAATCYLMVWLGGAGSVFLAITCIALAMFWWYLGPVLFKKKEKNPWNS